MSIIVTCCCGKRLEAPDAAAGRQGKCSACGRVVFIDRRTDQARIVWTGSDMQLLESAIQQAVCHLQEQNRETIVDEAEKWAKAWNLPPEKHPHESGYDLICDMVVSCLQRDAAVGMDSATVYQAHGEEMVRISASRQGKQLLHFIARVGPDRFMCWHHRDAEDEETENAKQRTDYLQSLSAGVHCCACHYHIGYVRVVSKTGLAPIVGYRCTVCQKIFCSKCHGKFEEGCPACKAPHEKLNILAVRMMANV